MQRIYLSLIAIFVFCTANAQLTTPADGGSAKASVTERIGITDVTINYGRPAVRGREGKIWGEVVHEGFQDQGYGNRKNGPWRAGANENTTIEFGTDVWVEGKPLHAGKYGFFIAYSPAVCTLIFSSNTSSWGSFFYEESEDVLRVTVKPVSQSQSKERLTYEFSNETDSSATISLVWEKLAIPFNVSTNLQQLQMASYERELRGEKGFDPHALQQVADYMAENSIRLNDALDYANRAANAMPVFSVIMTKGKVLEKMNKQAQADSILQMAINKGSAQEVHGYARSLLREKKFQKAFDVFQANYKHYPNTFTTNVGMARGYSAIGKPKDALKYATQALPLAPDQLNKKSIENMINTLKDGKELSVM
ncbi:MAG: hypothetical protein K0Q79_3689 [Flavipsychrobacter sp.]|jgi:hypothetical protein|nr:hypothetical protein [Flavipsychrobacter sp.]